MSALQELINKWEIEKGSYIPNAPIYLAFIEEARQFLEKEHSEKIAFAKLQCDKMAKEISEKAECQQCRSGKGCGIAYCDQLCYEVDKQSILSAAKEFIDNIK